MWIQIQPPPKPAGLPGRVSASRIMSAVPKEDLRSKSVEVFTGLNVMVGPSPDLGNISVESKPC